MNAPCFVLSVDQYRSLLALTLPDVVGAMTSSAHDLNEVAMVAIVGGQQRAHGGKITRLDEELANTIRK